MANIKVKIELGEHWTWISATVIDFDNKMTPLTINGTGSVEVEADVSDAGSARLVIHARGNNPATITANVVKNGKSISRKRTFKYSADGFVDRVVSFDPKA